MFTRPKKIKAKGQARKKIICGGRDTSRTKERGGKRRERTFLKKVKSFFS